MVTKGSNHPDPDGRTVFQMTGPLASTSRDQGPCARRKVTKETCAQRRCKVLHRILLWTNWLKYIAKATVPLTKCGLGT